MDLKQTLNLPRTAFPMKANLPASERLRLERWEAGRLYERVLAAREGAPVYVLHDGPPYPTGDIHLGQALNKILKDMVVKSKTMAGFRVPFIPGWDCHGLPIEVQVEKELGSKQQVSPVEFRRLCRQFAERYIEAHRRDFKRLGVFGQWEQPYRTMDFAFEARIAETFLTFLEKGLVYRGRKPVYWCLRDRTALAEAEVEYEDRESPSIWVRYRVIEPPAWLADQLPGALYAIIWTTTPWTLPASLALAFHPDLLYAVVLDEKHDGYVVAAQLVEGVAARTGLRLVRELATRPGRDFEGWRFQHPFLEREVIGVLADYVTLEQGSGIVHTAPGHGMEDYLTGQRYGLPPYAPLDDAGRFTEGLEEYRGRTVFEANQPIVELLRRRKALLAAGTVRHSYPHCWRCHNPVILRATEQWFIELDRSGLRQKALEEAGRVQWIPDWGGERMEAMLETRPDWCLSRQRIWGVPIVVFTCADCGRRLEDFSALRAALRWFEQEGADAWFSRSAEELLPPGTRCHCGSTRWQKENDILDVWFDSGSTHLAVLDDRTPDRRWPADLYLEGPDQYRGWFQSSLLIGVGVRGKAPYKAVLTHGWTLDAEGRPMSKSLGNVILPREIYERWGADLLRLWVAAQDYHADLRMSDRVMEQLAESYRKIRNTFRFALGNLFDFVPERDALDDERLWELDRWMLTRTAKLVEDAGVWYALFEFHRVVHAVQEFMVVELSAFYYDVLKDRLYTFPPASVGRRSAQTALWRIAHALVRVLAPVLVFTADEVWEHLPRHPDEPDSVHLTRFPTPEELGTRLEEARQKNWERLLEVRREVFRALEQARVERRIASSLEAHVRMTAGPELRGLLERYRSWLPAILLVSQVTIEPGEGVATAPLSGLDQLRVAVERAEGRRCERCWNYSPRVGESVRWPTVCERCVEALEEIERWNQQQLPSNA